MCGIAGILQKNILYTSEHVKKMTDALAHRGPDGEGCWENSNSRVLLGHRRLSILDLSEAAAQPMHYLDRYTIIHNGEIYNYTELREELKKNGYHFKTQTDTEVLIAAYDFWKEDCVQEFDGMFSFVIWDEKEKIFFAARDRFGEKPFFYVYDEGRQLFFFASEIKALHAIETGKQFNKKMLFNFLTIGYTDNLTQPEETFYDEIKKLPAASFLKISFSPDLKLSMEKYWDIDAEFQDKKIKEKEAIEKFSELFVTSVSRRLRSDVPLGTSLSGGLDSSSVAATICNLAGGSHPLQTFSVIFPGFEKNEERFIDTVTKNFSVQSHKTFITDEEVPVLPQYKIFELAKHHEVKVLLDGQGADETLAGYHKYYKWYWQELFIKRKLFRSGEIKMARELGIKEKFGMVNIIAAFFPDFASVFLERQYLLHALRQEDLTKEFVHLQSKEAYYTTPPISSLNGFLHFNTCMHGLEELLRYADRNSMAHGREVRLPFLSHELVEFIFSLPSHFKIRDGFTKWILRKSMEKKLPVEIVWRQDKIGLEPPQLAWMQLPAVQEMIHEAKNKLVSEKILKPEVLNKKIIPASAYDKNNYDWRYLVSAAYL